MKLFVLKLLSFIICTVLFYCCTLFVWGKIMPSILKSNLNYRVGTYGHMFTRLKEAKNVKNVDVLFLGSSHAYRGFDPRIFKKYGFSSFNLGSSSQTPLQTKVLLERYLVSVNPKLIVYEVYPGTFSSDGVESGLDLIANEKNDQFSKQMVCNINNIKVYNTYFYGLINDNLNLNKSFTESKKTKVDSYIEGGYVESKIRKIKDTTYKTKPWIFNEKQFKAFDEILLMLKEKKVRYILVYAPITKALRKSYTNNVYFDSVMNTKGPYYDFNYIQDLKDTEHFYDAHHLNQLGVNIFNHIFLDSLKNLK